LDSEEDPLQAAKARLRRDQPSKLASLSFTLEHGDPSQPGSANSDLEDNLARTLDMLGLDEQRRSAASHSQSMHAQTSDPEESKSLWIGNLPPTATRSDVEIMMQAFGEIESLRLLPAKNCGFVNFVNLADSVAAKKQLAGREYSGFTLKTGYAPRRSSIPFPAELQDPFTSQVTPAEAAAPIPQGKPYSSNLPSLPDATRCAILDATLLKDIRRRVESGGNFDQHFAELLPEAQFLSTDYIGNIIMQRLIEKSNHAQRLLLLQQVSPWLPAIGTHKNGTWVAQRMCDVAATPAEFSLISSTLELYVPQLLLDQFGNYVVQCCLRFGAEYNQFIFEAMASRCLEIATGRFGARSMRTCLESPYSTKIQQKQVAIAIVQNAVSLATNSNGCLLLTWLLDSSNLPGRFRVLVPRLLPQLPSLFCNKLASTIVVKLIAQRVELDAKETIMAALFKVSKDSGMLEQILTDQQGIPVLQKLLASLWLDVDERCRMADAVRVTLHRMDVRNKPAYKRLLDELCLLPIASEEATRAVLEFQRFGAYMGFLPGQEIPPAIQQTLYQHQQQAMAAAAAIYGGFYPY
jgi:hypothetical protein